jgi:hypothetical protein
MRSLCRLNSPCCQLPAPSSSGLGHWILSPSTGVQIPLGSFDLRLLIDTPEHSLGLFFALVGDAD